MNLDIRPMAEHELEAVVQLSLAAWAPVYRSFENELGSTIYGLLFPDWTQTQRTTVETFCKDTPKMAVWVADVDAVVTGFMVYELNHTTHIGEVHLLAVHPDYQGRGIGTALNIFALQKLKEHGMHLAVVGTGGDPGHAPARRAYEKVGYTPLRAVQYYQAL